MDVICGELQANATAHATELIAAYRTAREAALRRILLGIICDANLPEALPLLVDCLRSDDEGVRHMAIECLRRLDTKEARQALWNSGHPRRGRPEAEA